MPRSAEQQQWAATRTLRALARTPPRGSVGDCWAATVAAPTTPVIGTPAPVLVVAREAETPGSLLGGPRGGAARQPPGNRPPAPAASSAATLCLASSPF